jgi:hypothetical protein
MAKFRFDGRHSISLALRFPRAVALVDLRGFSALFHYRFIFI